MKPIKEKSISSHTPRIHSKPNRIPRTMNRAIHQATNKIRTESPSSQTNQEDPTQTATHQITHSGEQVASRTSGQIQHEIRKTKQSLSNRSRLKRATNHTRQTIRNTTQATQNTVKATSRSGHITRTTIKTGAKTVKSSAQAAQASAKVAKLSAQVSQRAAHAAVQAAKVASKVTIQVGKIAVKAIIATAKATVAAVKGLVSLIAAGGWVAVLVIILVAIIGWLIISPLSIFYSSTDSSTQEKTIPSVMAELAQETTNEISQIQTQYGEGCDIKIIYEGSEDGTMIQNGPDILSVYAVRVTMDPANQNEVITLDDQKESILRDTYHQMVTVSYTIVEKEPTETTDASATTSAASTNETTATVSTTPTPTPVTKELCININCLSADEMVVPLGFTDEQVTMLQELLKPDYLLLFQSLLGIQNPAGLTQEEINQILASLPKNLSIQQTQVVEKSLSLVGKVSYFWGGKSNAIDWDSRWGTSMTVTADGSDTTGTTRPFGLDCSGYVAWVYINCGLPADKVDSIFGYSTSTQWKYTTAIEWDQAHIGDLVFFNVPGAAKGNHVGIIVGYDDAGKYLIAHCSSSRNCVVVTEAVSSGFHYVRRPIVINEQALLFNKT